MIKKKHLRPELREKYDFYEQEFLTKHRKKHMILFLIWLAVWLVGVACILFLEPDIIISFCFMLWAVGGLVCTLIYNHHCMMYIEAHVYDNPDEEPAVPSAEPEEPTPAEPEDKSE